MSVPPSLSVDVWLHHSLSQISFPPALTWISCKFLLFHVKKGAFSKRLGQAGGITLTDSDLPQQLITLAAAVYQFAMLQIFTAA